MKAVLVRISMVLAVTVLSLIGLSAQAQAGGQCQINLRTPCEASPNYGPHMGYFHDGVPLSDLNATRCLQRADEYFAWCGNARGKQQVVASYVIKGVHIIYKVRNSDGSYIASPLSSGNTGVIYTP